MSTTTAPGPGADVYDYLHTIAARNSKTVRRVVVAPLSDPGSYFSAHVTIEYATGRSDELFFKDLSRSYRPKEDLGARRDREVHVYRNLLADAGLGTAALVDVRQDPVTGQYWLLLEGLPGTIIEDANDRLGVEAVSWLGRMQGHFVSRAADLIDDGYLIQHDYGFFRAPLEKGMLQVEYLAPDSSHQFRALAATYDAVAELLANQPRTLVHGGFIPWHIIVDTTVPQPRISAVDWELAAAGSPLFDLAYFTHWANPDARTSMYAAYRLAAEAHGVPLPPGDEMRRIMAGFRLYRTVAWLSQSSDHGFSPTKVAKLVRRASRLSDDLLA